MARIMEFFVSFLLRSKVLPENERSLRKSLEVINVAKKELPNTSAIAKAFPDVFSRACGACWGWKAEGYQVITLDESTTADAPGSKVEDAVEEQKQPETTSGWGSSSGWGAPAGDSPWNVGVSDGSGWGSWGGSVIPESVPEPSPWDGIKQDSLMSLLGPTVLPLTHTTGIVEKSMRRIKAILPLPTNPPRPPPQPEGFYEPDAAAVESDFDRSFVKVVLEPMPIDWDGGEVLAYSKPEILGTSKAPATAADGATTTAPKPHDPLTDEIQLPIEPKAETIKLLSVGMGLGGTWVQIVREGEPVKKKKKCKSKNKTPPSYWYLDTLGVVIPSFWTIKS